MGSRWPARARWRNLVAFATTVIVAGCALDRTGYRAIDGGGPAVGDSEVPRRDARDPAPMDAEPPPLGDVGGRDLGRPDTGRPGLPDAGPIDPPDTRPMDPPDMGPPDPFDLGPMDPPDLGPIEPIDLGSSVTDEERCRASYGGIAGFVFCFAGAFECGFSSRFVPCELACISGRGICLRAHDNPNEMGEECTMGDDLPCMDDSHTTNLCVCTQP